MRRRDARSPREVKKIFASSAVSSSTSTTRSASRGRGCALHRPGSPRIFRRRAARRLRHDPRAVRRHHGRLFASRRGSRSDRDRRRAAQARSVLERTAWRQRRYRPTACPAARPSSNWAMSCTLTNEMGSPTIFRRDGRFTDMVMADLAGAFEAPIYGMLDVDKRIEAHDWGALRKADDPLSRSARGRRAIRRCCGTANGRSPM